MSRRSRSTLRTRIVGLLIIAGIGVGVWMLNGQPDMFKLVSSHLITPAKELFTGTDEPTDVAPSDSANSWTCVWSPTRDNDWHNDVECFDGTQVFRPILLADIPHVSEAQMRAASEEYEDYLNAGGAPDVP